MSSRTRWASSRGVMFSKRWEQTNRDEGWIQTANETNVADQGLFVMLRYSEASGFLG